MPAYTIASATQCELDIRKSRFIGVVMPVADRAEAALHIQAMRAVHPAATHVCWAVLAGGQSGMSDDGEPSGTAGRPILEVLRHHEVDGVLGMVVRYYGGIKLGAGGLVRAYTDAIAGAMKLAQRTERIVMAELAIEIAYPDESKVRRWLEQQGYILVQCSHGTAVTLQMRMPLDQIENSRAALRDLTQGRISIAGADAPSDI